MTIQDFYNSFGNTASTGGTWTLQSAVDGLGVPLTGLPSTVQYYDCTSVAPTPMSQVLTFTGTLFSESGGFMDTPCVDFTGVKAGVYTFIYTQNSGDGCEQSAPLEVIVNESPILALVDDDQTIQMCLFDGQLGEYNICGRTFTVGGALYPETILYNVGTTSVVGGTSICTPLSPTMPTAAISTGTGGICAPEHHIYTLSGIDGINSAIGSLTETNIDYCVQAVTNDGCEDTATFSLQVMPDIQTGECLSPSYCQGFTNLVNPSTDWLNAATYTALTASLPTYSIDVSIASSTNTIPSIPYSGGTLSTTGSVSLADFTMVDLSGMPANTQICFDFTFSYTFAGATTPCEQVTQCCIEILTGGSAGTATSVTVCN